MQYFGTAEVKLQEMGVTPHLVPMIIFKRNSLMLKYHMQQPELPNGIPNPHMEAKPIWTVSVSDGLSPETVKIGWRKNKPLLVPWNPHAADVCIQAEDNLVENYQKVKDRDFLAAHFTCKRDELTRPYAVGECISIPATPFSQITPANSRTDFGAVSTPPAEAVVS